jgi:hypothetical protein
VTTPLNFYFKDIHNEPLQKVNGLQFLRSSFDTMLKVFREISDIDIEVAHIPKAIGNKEQAIGDAKQAEKQKPPSMNHQIRTWAAEVDDALRIRLDAWRLLASDQCPRTLLRS